MAGQRGHGYRDARRSGRATIAAAWRQLPDDVRNGPLRGDDDYPSRRVVLPLLRGFFPNARCPQSVKRLNSATVLLDDTESDAAIASLLAGAAVLRQVGELFSTVHDALSGGGNASRDVINTAIFTTFYTAAGAQPPAPVSESALAVIVAELVARFSADENEASPDQPITVARLKRAYEDASVLDWLTSQLQLAREQSPQERHIAPEHTLKQFLNLVVGQRPPGEDMPDTLYSMDAWLEDTWRQIIAAPDSSPHAAQSSLLGLSRGAGTRPEPGSVDEPRTSVYPMDWSVYRRAWGVARSGVGRTFVNQLPPVLEILEKVAASYAYTYHLHEPEARAALTVAAYAYIEAGFGLSPDPSDQREEANAEVRAAASYRLSRITAGGRLLADALRNFLKGIGGGDDQLGWARLSRPAQDQVEQLARTLIPELWKAEHNAQYRPGGLDNAGRVWTLIRGELTTLFGNIRNEHTRNPAIRAATLHRLGHDAQRDEALEHSTAPDTDDEPIQSDLLRDERVRITLAQYATSRGEETLEAFYRTLHTHHLVRGPEPLEEARRSWESVAAEIRNGAASTHVTLAAGAGLATDNPHERVTVLEDAELTVTADLAATWTDLLGYLDANFASWVWPQETAAPSQHTHPSEKRSV